MVPKLLWTDEGTGGRAGSLWTINRLGLFAATVGHKPPSGPFYDFKAKTFTVVDDGGGSDGGSGEVGDGFLGTGEEKDSERNSETKNSEFLSHPRTESNDDRRTKMLKLMRRKSLHQDDVNELKRLMEEEKNRQGDSEVSNPLSLLTSLEAEN